MNINVYLEDALAQSLNHSAKALGATRNALIREAIKEWLLNHSVKKWPTRVLRFQGVKQIPAFESYRDELLPSREDPFA